MALSPKNDMGSDKFLRGEDYKSPIRSCEIDNSSADKTKDKVTKPKQNRSKSFSNDNGEFDIENLNQKPKNKNQFNNNPRIGYVKLRSQNTDEKINESK